LFTSAIFLVVLCLAPISPRSPSLRKICLCEFSVLIFVALHFCFALPPKLGIFRPISVLLFSSLQFTLFLGTTPWTWGQGSFESR
jgi:hypothetical protein